ncbi:MAG: hypothetical protein ACFFAO_20845, partial [Candidatus Hermodarchaeota archaeon]
MYRSDLGYDRFLVELWSDACKKFVDIKEKKYLLQSLDKLNNHLKTPQNSEQLFHYFYSYNCIWQFKSKFLALDMGDFWKMMFYRALYEEEDFALAEKLKDYLPEDLKSLLIDLNSLYNDAKQFKLKIYGLNEDSTSISSNVLINKMILRINSEGVITFRIISKDFKIMGGKITNECWNDTQIMKIYNDLFSENQEKEYSFDLIDFGKLLFTFLPKTIRNLFKNLKAQEIDYYPQIFFILDNMTIPFDLIYDDNFFMLKYSCGYKIGEPPLEGLIFEHDDSNVETVQIPANFNILIFEAMNSRGPIKWNEEIKKNMLIFPFVEGINEMNHTTNFFNTRSEINEITLLNGFNASRDKILESLSQKDNHIIHFIGNIFYSTNSPKDSFILTNDNNLITFNEIKIALDNNPSNIQPILVFDAQFFDIKGNKLNNVLRNFGEIISQFNYETITGIISRIYPLFSLDAREILTNFYI